MATGWLIAPDMLVTAGHVAFDFGPTTQYGKAVIVKAYMGYSGAVNLTPTNLGSVNGAAPAVQLQYGATFITTTGWLQSGGQAERADVAFLKLSGSFIGNFKPFSYVDTPLSAPATSPVTIGVVGYPADEKNRVGEEGAEMYQSFLPTSWNLDTDFGNLLTYTISTYPGKLYDTLTLFPDGKMVATIWSP
jgi:V8-like Glu-specific endopeptidase